MCRAKAVRLIRPVRHRATNRSTSGAGERAIQRRTGSVASHVQRGAERSSPRPSFDSSHEITCVRYSCCSSQTKGWEWVYPTSR
jgi:hypothetical protein